MLIDHLWLAEQHIADGAMQVDRQRRLVSELHHQGHDTFRSRELLRVFEDLLAMHIQDRDRILSKLAEENGSH